MCAALSLWLLRPAEDAEMVEIVSDGQVLYTLSLQENQEIPVITPLGSNTVTIQNGKVAVTHADCPDGHCMNRGWCSGGVPIVCLPNRLQIRFLGEQPLDGISG